MADERDTSFLTDEEVENLNATPKNDDEPETTPEEPKVEIKEPSPPESVVEVKTETQPKVKPEEFIPPQIEGILTKDGKNVIPFSVLEQERTKRQQVEAELTELRKPKVEVQPKVIQPEPKTEEGIDFNALAEKLYGSQDGAAEVLKMVFEAGTKIASEAGSTAAERSTLTARFQDKVEVIKAQNPWLKDAAEELVTLMASKRIQADPAFNPNDLNSLVRVTEEAMKEVKSLLKVDVPQIDEAKIRKDEREKATKEIMQTFNITVPKVVTLAGARNANPDIQNKFDTLDELNGIEFEEAFGQLTPQERAAFLVRTNA